MHCKISGFVIRCLSWIMSTTLEIESWVYALFSTRRTSHFQGDFISILFLLEWGLLLLLFPYVHHLRFVDKTTLAVGSHVNEFASLDTTGTRSSFNIHYIALLSFKFLPSFGNQKLFTLFHVSLIMVGLPMRESYTSGNCKVNVVFSIQRLV